MTFSINVDLRYYGVKWSHAHSFGQHFLFAQHVDYMIIYTFLSNHIFNGKDKNLDWGRNLDERLGNPRASA